MTGFNAEQLRTMNTSTSHAAAAASSIPAPPDLSAPIPPPAPPTDSSVVADIVTTQSSEAETLQARLAAIVSDCIAYRLGQPKTWAADTFFQVASPGVIEEPQKLLNITSYSFGPSSDVVWISYTTISTTNGQSFNGTCVLKRNEVSGVECGFVQSTAVWSICMDHRSRT